MIHDNPYKFEFTEQETKIYTHKKKYLQKVTCVVNSTMVDPRIPPAKPHFFKPLLPGFHTDFLIPTSFFKYLDGEKCENAVLRTRNGKLWAVKINGRRIEDGWTNFAQDHDLHIGDILVFRHEGNLVFDVMVFDPSACERQYPPLDTIDEVDSMEEMMSERCSEAESVEYLNESEETQRNKHVIMRAKSNATSSFMFRNPYFVSMMKPSNKGSTLFIPKYFSMSNGLSSGCCKMILKDPKQRLWPVKLQLTRHDKRLHIWHGWHDFHVANGLKDGDAFGFELIKKGKEPIMKFHWLDRNPMAEQEMTPKAKASSVALGQSYFFHIIKPSNLLNHGVLHIPRHFARSNGLHNKCGEMILKNQKGASWPVTLMHQKLSGQVYIGSGWKKFTVENGLKEGDGCILELIKGGKKLIMNYYGLGGNPMGKQEMTPEAKATSSTLGKSYFCHTITQSYLWKHALYIPKDFARSNGLHNKCGKMILKNQKGVSWPAILRHQKSSGQVFIGHGWREFAVENGLKEGDKCILELVQEGKKLTLIYYGC